MRRAPLAALLALALALAARAQTSVDVPSLTPLAALQQHACVRRMGVGADDDIGCSSASFRPAGSSPAACRPQQPRAAHALPDAQRPTHTHTPLQALRVGTPGCSTL